MLHVLYILQRITIEATLKRDMDNKTISKQELSKVLAVIGEQVLEVDVYYNDCDVTLGLKSLKNKCKNLESITVSGVFAEQEILCFTNLKRLAVIINGRYISLQEWKNFFASSPALEELNYYESDVDYEDGFMEMLTHLPKLQSLRLPWFFDSLHQSPDFQHLLQLTGLTKLSLRSTDNLNGILVDLANSMNLVELNIHMRFDGESLGIIKSFHNLEVLSIHLMESWNESSNGTWFSNVLVFPPKLQRLNVNRLDMSCSKFVELLQHLTFLTEFYLHGDLFWNGRTINFKDSQPMVIKAIENTLIRNGRKLKFLHFHSDYLWDYFRHFWDEEDELLYLYRSDHLQIMNSDVVEQEAYAGRIFVDCET